MKRQLERTCICLHSRAFTVRSAGLRALGRHERGDVPGWVLVTLMTAGLVVVLWATAGPLLVEVFTNAINKVTGKI